MNRPYAKRRKLGEHLGYSRRERVRREYRWFSLAQGVEGKEVRSGWVWKCFDNKTINIC